MQPSASSPNSFHDTPLLEAVIEQTNEAILITEGTPIGSPGPRITYVNRAFTEITGYEAEEVIGKTPRILQGPATEPWVLERLRHRLEQGEPFEGEAINYRKDGTPYVNQWSISPVRNSDDVITQWVSIQRDVTEERHMGHRLLEAQEQERAHMARTMHDELGGELTSLQMLVGQLRTVVPNDAPTSPLNEIETRINALSTTVRRLTGTFSSPLLGDFGLSEATAQLVKQIEVEEGLTVHLRNTISPSDQLCPLLEHLLFRILRDTLTEVARHTDSTTAKVLLGKTDRELKLHVLDLGADFDPSVLFSDGRGQHSSAKQERIDHLNGSLSIDTSSGNDTRLTVTLPLPVRILRMSSAQVSS